MEDLKMEESKHTVCCRCKYFNKYYTKGLKDFVGTELGWCREKEFTTGLHNTCQHFEYRPRKKISSRTLKVHISNMLVEITGLYNIIKKELEEDERTNL